MSTNGTWDAVVAGGGPAGAATATVLAQHGRKVLLLEREQFPRHHIGESLMPYTWFSFERLGVLDWLKTSGSPLKHSVQFVSTSGKVSQPFYFFQTIEHECASTWQILRSDFDRMMLENAASHGVEVREGVRVQDVILDGNQVVGVTAQSGNTTEELSSKVVVDATGRDFSIGRHDGREPMKPDHLAGVQGGIVIDGTGAIQQDQGVDFRVFQDEFHHPTRGRDVEGAGHDGSRSLDIEAGRGIHLEEDGRQFLASDATIPVDVSISHDLRHFLVFICNVLDLKSVFRLEVVEDPLDFHLYEGIDGS